MSRLRWCLFTLAGVMIASGAWKFFELGHWAFGSSLVVALIALIVYRVFLEPDDDEPEPEA